MTRISKKAWLAPFLLFALSVVSLHAQDLQTAIKLYKSEQFAASSSMFKQLLKEYPNDGDIYYYNGVRFLREYFAITINISLKEMGDSAMMMYTLGTEKDPQNPLNYIGLGKIELYTDNIAKAEEYFAKANSLLPSKANKSIQMSPERQCIILYNMAEAYVLAGVRDTSKVFSLLRRAEKLNKKDPQLYIVYGDAYFFLLNDGSRAIANYNMAQSLDPKSPEAKLRVGQLWMRARNYMDALNTYKEVVDIDSTFAPAYRELGYLYSRASRNDDAQYNYKKFLTLSSNNTTARKQYVNTLIELKNYPEAIKELQAIIKVDTMDNDVNRALAYCYFETGDYDEGLLYSRKFFKNANPKKIRPADYAYLGRLLAKTKQDSAAHEMLVKAFILDSTKSELLSEAAMSLNRIKKYDKAIDIYQTKISLGKATANDWYNMGKAYYNLQEWGKVDTTLAYYNTLMPDHIAGYQWRARALVNMDPDTKLGLAKPVWELLIENAAADSTKYSKELIEAYLYLAYYYLLQFNATKDQENGKKSLEFGYKILALDPNNEKGKEFVRQIEPRIKK